MSNGTRRWTPEDVALWKAGPEYAESLGVGPPRCCRCGGVLRTLPGAWDGGPVMHLLPCDLVAKWKRGALEEWQQAGVRAWL